VIPVIWWVAITAIGTVLAGLALPLALIQLGALRQDRLRAQVSKVGAWVETPKTIYPESDSWTVPVRVRNGSELPVRVDTIDLVIRPWGYGRVLAAPEATSEPECYMDKRFGDSDQAYFAPGTIAPEDTLEQGVHLCDEGALRAASAAHCFRCPCRRHGRRGLPVGNAVR
jgi:hypothetical protein